MALPVSLNLPPIAPPELAKVPGPGAGSAPGAFESVFNQAVNRVEAFQQQASDSIDRFLSGEDEEIHHVALAEQQADLSFQLFLQTRNKIVEAYQEVMKMPV